MANGYLLTLEWVALSGIIMAPSRRILRCVSSDLKFSVCFLCGRKEDGSYDARGTAFFVSVPSESRPNDVWYIYLITAKHVIDKAKAKGYSNFHLRINTRSGVVEFVEVPDNWKYPNPAGPGRCGLANL